MTGLIYVDEAPTTDQRNGLVTIDLRSGGETISIIVTRHAAQALSRRVATQLLFLDDAEQDQNVIAFPARERRNKGKAS